MEWTPDSKAASRLLRSLHKPRSTDVSPFLKPDGSYTAPGDHTVAHLMDSHFPHSTPPSYPRYTHQHVSSEEVSASLGDVIDLSLIHI